MIIWVKVPLPPTLEGTKPPYPTRTFRFSEPVRDPSLVYDIGRTTGGHISPEGVLHVQVELNEEALLARLAERRGVF